MGKSTPERIAEVLRAAERPMRGRDILTAIEARGWKSYSVSPYSVMRDALETMKGRGEVEHVGHGLWKLKSS